MGWDHGSVARLAIEADQLVISLSRAERLMAFHGDLRLPLRAVRAAAVEQHPYRALRGIRAPGTGWPGVVAYGVRRMTGERPDFAALRGQDPAVRLWLDHPSPFAQVLVSTRHAEDCVHRIRSGASWNGSSLGDRPPTA